MRLKKQLWALLALFPFIPFAAQANVASTPIGNVTWDKTAFSPASSTQIPTLYLGAKVADATDDNTKAHSLASAKLGVGNDGKAAVVITPLAPAMIKLNGADDANPLNNVIIPNLTLFNGTLPVVTNDIEVYMVTKPQDGSEVITNDPDVVKDANNPADVTKQIKALAASSDTIFAAVSASGKDWEDATANGVHRGIAVIQKAPAASQLLVKDATNFANAEKAVKLSLLPADELVAFDAANAKIATAELGPNVDMFWNDNLQRLYVGLSNVHRDDNSKEGGCLGLVMGRIDTTAVAAGELKLQPVVSGVTKGHFYNDADAVTTNAIDRIVGFYADGIIANAGDKPFNVSVNQMRSMRTSTGKDYLIVNSNVGFAAPFGGGKNVAGVFALPVWPSDDANPEKVGTIVEVANDGIGRANFAALPGGIANMPKAEQKAVRVGSIDPANISDIFVEGDAVYMCGNPLGNDQAGIFVSTALFDENGSIRGWTPAQRVYGSIDRVWGAGLDTVVGNFSALTSQSLAAGDLNKINTVKITQWGKTNSNTNLIELLEQQFPLEKGGLVALHAFDIFTPGFNEHFSMLVAVGVDKIALIQTGKVVGGQFVLEDNFVIDTNVFIYDAADIQALADIAPLTGAEVSRMVGNDEGWLFVCGCNGVAVLSNDTASVGGDVGVTANAVSPAGRGWMSSNVQHTFGLDMLRAGDAGALINFFPGGANWTWKKLVGGDAVGGNPTDPFKNVLKLVAAAGRMYVVTLDGIFFFDMEAGKFDGGPTVNLGDTAVAGLPAGTLVADLSVVNPNDATDPAKVADNRGIIGTNEGLFASKLSNVAKDTALVTDEIGDIALHLQQLGDINSQAPQTANVYVLGTDFENNNDKLFRFDVPDAIAAVGALVEPVMVPNTDGLVREFNSSKQSFDTDGTFVRSTLPKNYDQVELLTLHPVDNSTGGIDVTSMLELDLEKNKYISGVGRDGGTGAILVPGDWSLRVNK